MTSDSSSKFIVDFFVGSSVLNWSMYVQRFEWISMVDGGYTARFSLTDPGLAFHELIFNNDYLSKARREPLWVKFRIGWENGRTTPYKYGIITDVNVVGRSANEARFNYIILDPISYYLNRGNASGGVYYGKIGGAGGVIDQILRDNLPQSISTEIGGNIETIRFKKNVSGTTDLPYYYWQMRQPVKTFISSILDWSSSVTDRKTPWKVTSGTVIEDGQATCVINIIEYYQESLKYPATVDGVDERSPLIFYYGNSPDSAAKNILKWELLCDNLLVEFSNNLVTSGMSAISGEYLDPQTDVNRQYVYVNDARTENKPNAVFGPDRGFAKPDINSGGRNHIIAVPEFNAGELGRNYKEYIDGRARKTYVGLLHLLMRVKLTVRGEPRLHDPMDLGESFCTLQWITQGIEDNYGPDFMDGNWMVYGWHHVAKQYRDWDTYVYLARLDYNADSKPGWNADTRRRGG